MSEERDRYLNWQESHQYDDIINLPRPVSKTHRPMTISDRAAQFAPFSALTGLNEALEDTNEIHVEREERR